MRASGGGRRSPRGKGKPEKRLSFQGTASPSPPRRALPAPPQRGWPAPRSPGARGRAPSPAGPGADRLPGAPRGAPPPAPREARGVREARGDPRGLSLKSGARREEGSLSHKCGGGARGVEPIKRGGGPGAGPLGRELGSILQQEGDLGGKLTQVGGAGKREKAPGRAGRGRLPSRDLRPGGSRLLPAARALEGPRSFGKAAPAPLTRLPRRRRRCGRDPRGRLGRRLRAALLLGVDVLRLRLLAPRHGASMGAPAAPRRLARSAARSRRGEIYPPPAGTRMSR